MPIRPLFKDAYDVAFCNIDHQGGMTYVPEEYIGSNAASHARKCSTRHELTTKTANLERVLIATNVWSYTRLNFGVHGSLLKGGSL